MKELANVLKVVGVLKKKISNNYLKTVFSVFLTICSI